MISCCAHYLVNLIPILGATGLVTFATQYQVKIFWVGLAFNLFGIWFIGNRIVGFKKAYEIYSLFWALRLKLVSVVGVKKIGDNQLNIHDTSGSNKPMTKEDIISKLVDCCKE